MIIMTKLIEGAGGGPVVRSTHIKWLTTTWNFSLRRSSTSGLCRQHQSHTQTQSQKIFYNSFPSEEREVRNVELMEEGHWFIIINHLPITIHTTSLPFFQTINIALLLPFLKMYAVFLASIVQVSILCPVSDPINTNILTMLAFLKVFYAHPVFAIQFPSSKVLSSDNFSHMFPTILLTHPSRSSTQTPA